MLTTSPENRVAIETIEYKDSNLTVWDIGGRERIRPFWRLCYKDAQALVLVVDSTDREKIPYACKELHATLKEDELGGKPLLVLANKQDVPNTMSVSEITEELELENISGRKWYVQPTVATSNEGLKEGFDWLSDALVNTKASVLEPLIETVNDSKLMKDIISLKVKSFKLKSIFAKLIHH